MKDSLISILIVMIFGLLIVVGARAADNAAVTATVTVQNIAMTLSQSSFDYGTMLANTTSSTLALFSGAGIVVTNTGNVNEDFDINGANTGTGAAGNGWDLDTATSTANIYAHRFCNDTDDVCTTAWTNYSAMTTSPGALDTAVAASGTVNFQLEIHTPLTTTKTTQQSAAVTVTASAS